MTMNKLIVALALLASACTTTQPTADSTSQRLIIKDQNCAAIKDEVTCVDDKADGCEWEETGLVSQIACPAGEKCPTPISSGVCVGNPGTDPCAILDQCSNSKDETTCGALPNCAWEAAACPAILVEGDGGTSVCEPFVCVPTNPCATLDDKTCDSNPACELVTTTSGCATPAYVCAKGEGCPPAPVCPPPVITTTCQPKALVCDGSKDPGTGGGTTGSGSGTSTGSGGDSTNGGTAKPL